MPVGTHLARQRVGTEMLRSEEPPTGRPGAARTHSCSPGKLGRQMLRSNSSLRRELLIQIHCLPLTTQSRRTRQSHRNLVPVPRTQEPGHRSWGVQRWGLRIHRSVRQKHLMQAEPSSSMMPPMRVPSPQTRQQMCQTSWGPMPPEPQTRV